MSGYTMKKVSDNGNSAFELWQGDEKVRTFIIPILAQSVADCINMETAPLHETIEALEKELGDYRLERLALLNQVETLTVNERIANESIAQLDAENKRLKQALEDCANGILEANSESDYMRVYHKVVEDYRRQPAPVDSAAPDAVQATRFKVGAYVSFITKTTNEYDGMKGKIREYWGNGGYSVLMPELTGLGELYFAEFELAPYAEESALTQEEIDLIEANAPDKGRQNAP